MKQNRIASRTWVAVGLSGVALKQQRLTLVLLKPGTKLADVLRTEIKDTLQKHKLKAELELHGAMWTRSASMSAPSWADFLASATNETLQHLRAKHSSALITLRVNGRRFCLLFGHSKGWLREETIERRFGMIVTLNCVNRNKLRSVDREEFDTVTRTTRSQTSRMATIENFGLDVQRDLLRSVTGEPRNKKFASHVTGSDKLVITSKMTIQDLKQKCATCLKYYKKETYKKRFPWVENFQRIADAALIGNLEDQLFAEIRSESTDHIYISPPSVIDTQEARVYRYPGQRKTRSPYEDIRLDELRNMFR